jgi:hypothetical protein
MEAVMTNSEVSELKKGDRVTDGAVTYELTTDAQPSRSATHYEAWATSLRGSLVARVTANGNFVRVAPMSIIKGGLS